MMQRAIILVLLLALGGCGSHHDTVPPGGSGGGSSSVSSSSSSSTSSSSTGSSSTGGPSTLAIMPPSASVAPNGTLMFACTAASCAWSVQEGATGGSVVPTMGGAGAVYTAPSTPGPYHLVATDGTQKATATITVLSTSDCGSLPPVGQWQDITPPEFHQPSNMQTDVLAVHPLDQSVFALAQNFTNMGTGSTGLYKSTDCGKTFTLVSTGQGKDTLETSSVWSIALNPQDPMTMYLGAGYGGNTIFRSINGGVDWVPLKPDADDALPLHDNFVQAIALDPTNPKHLVLTFHDSCATKYNPNCMSQTYDGGDTWQEFSGPSDLGGWEESSSISILGPTTYFYAAAGAYKGYSTTDSGKTWTKVLDAPLYASYVPSVHVAHDGRAYVGSLINGVYYSTDLGVSWTLIPGSPSSTAVSDDGTSLYASADNDHGGMPFWVTPLSGVTGMSPMWTQMKTPTSVSVGTTMFSYDATHHLLYSANLDAGLWRLRTQ
jgi:photosystem II stability/assembly factor-like uncharacterized protein